MWLFLADVPLAIEVFIVSILRGILASYPSCLTIMFCAGSFVVSIVLNLNPLAVYSPLAKVLNWVKPAPKVQLPLVVVLVSTVTTKVFAVGTFTISYSPLILFIVQSPDADWKVETKNWKVLESGTFVIVKVPFIPEPELILILQYR